MHLMNAFLADTGGVRTQNPWEANLFYVPTFAYFSTGGWRSVALCGSRGSWRDAHWRPRRGA